MSFKESGNKKLIFIDMIVLYYYFIFVIDNILLVFYLFILDLKFNFVIFLFNYFLFDF